MSDKPEFAIQTKAELREGRIPGHWEDLDGITEVEAHHRPFLFDNPLSHSDDDPVRAYALFGNQVAGRLGMTIGEIRVDGESLQVLWGFNLFISKRFRRRGLAIELIRCWRDAHHTSIGMHVNLPSLGIYHKLGWTQVDTPNVYTILRIRKFIEGYAPWGPLGAVAGPPVDAALSIRRAVGRLGGPAPRRGLVAEPATRMPGDIDDEMLGRSRAAATTHRSVAWINWMLDVSDADDKRDAHLFLVRESGGRVVGYFIVQFVRRRLMSGRFRDLPVGSLMDWDVFDEGGADLHSLVLLAEAECRRLGAATFFATIKDPGVARGLVKLGFRTAQPLRTLFHAVPPSPLVDPRFTSVDNWHVAPADDDGLFI
jgi:GNAT superfamily N-acetyltransferase